ncbi:hypothetical protein PGT21_009477 [Puccinia graminis f. sp. tritici]|uniref:Uncharacterized protein n=1 Tax=Puccinia graminis f. sp. tritici TaxID=56615 RepID=A0A5B0Q5H2_PUCGR|nr:hypothetical protein PGT21_009477 [Puccinia graminis f. sp. tritici]
MNSFNISLSLSQPDAYIPPRAYNQPTPFKIKLARGPRLHQTAIATSLSTAHPQRLQEPGQSFDDHIQLFDDLPSDCLTIADHHGISRDRTNYGRLYCLFRLGPNVGSLRRRVIRTAWDGVNVLYNMVERLVSEKRSNLALGATILRTPARLSRLTPNHGSRFQSLSKELHDHSTIASSLPPGSLSDRIVPTTWLTVDLRFQSLSNKLNGHSKITSFQSLNRFVKQLPSKSVETVGDSPVILDSSLRRTQPPQSKFNLELSTTSSNSINLTLSRIKTSVFPCLPVQSSTHPQLSCGFLLLNIN